MTVVLHPRSTSTKDMERRAKAQAHRILDRLAAGGDDTKARIEWALRMTGDLTADLPHSGELTEGATR